MVATATAILTQPITYFETLLNKISHKTAKVAIIGLGYVGLPNVVSKAKLGFNVIGFDIDTTKIENINRGDNYISDVDSELLSILVAEGKIKATSDFSKLSDVDIITICVPTPIDEYKQPDLKPIISAMDKIQTYVSYGTLIMLESTTYPGTTEEFMVKPLETMGYNVGTDIFVAYSPERIDPSNSHFTIDNTPRIVGGYTSNCTALAGAFVGNNVKEVSSTKVAEMAKVYENTFRYVNIALANELALISDKMGIDVWEVIDASKTKPFGFMPFYPSSGVGGHCIPVDPYYLSYKAKQFDYHAKMIELAGDLDAQMKEYTINKIIKILNETGKTIKRAKIAILGVTYKKDVADVRESSIFKLVERLDRYQANVTLYDPYVSEVTAGGKSYSVKPLNKRELSSFDLVMILTDHSNIDYPEVLKRSEMVFDTRNVMQMPEIPGQYYKL